MEIALGIAAYYLIGVYVSCVWFNYVWPICGVDGEAIAMSMTLCWIFWPLLGFYTLLHSHFNQSKGGHS